MKKKLESFTGAKFEISDRENVSSVVGGAAGGIEVSYQYENTIVCCEYGEETRNDRKYYDICHTT